ncbi:protein MCM10 homolog [Diabrotica virgifera virgifera]|uniref:Protein MCM10 homolog n=1 Tax=Diabrotica virgifera virgifera TaxID=50390 RepID=A0ABM5KVQ4_DIAVI|nr:protein MCM10 homolog [Diabrotica virgifera virgifera]
MGEDCDPLDLLLLAAAEELEDSSKNQIKPKSLKETNLFEQESNINIKPLATTTNNSIIHTGDTDSSDDEDRRNWEEKKYTESGREIKKILDVPTKIGSNKSRISRVSNWKKPSVSVVKETNKKTVNPLTNPNPSVFSQADVIFGIRVINPLVSSAVIAERMIGREAIQFNRLGRFLQIKTDEKDWVIAGVVVHKSAAKTSQKGNQFSVWTLTDLRDDIKTVAVFLFGGAHGQLWKTSVGTVVGLLNPNVLEKKEGRDEASLSIDNAQKVMILGQSKDFGICKSVKKNGDKCTAIVNLAMCQYCVFHIKQEYQKCSIRSDLQSSFTGKGLTALRNKVLGKNEVFYAGKSYMAIPAKKSRKLEQKDNARLDSLFGKGIPQTSLKAAPVKKKSSAARLEVPQGQRLKDLQLLEKLSGVKDLSEKTEFEGKQSSDVTIGDAKSLASSVLSRLKAKNKVSENKVDSGARESVQSSEESVETTPKKIKGQLPIDKFRELENNLTKIMVSPTTNKVPAKESNNLTRKSLFENDLTKQRPTLENPFSGVPKLSGFASGSIDLSKPIIPRRSDKAKAKAIRLIQQKGPIKKTDPNNIRGTGIKRSIDIEGGDKLDLAPKKLKVDETNTFTSERFKKIMAASSSHLDLVESRDEEEKDKYFNKLEAKEKMEEKMINTHKVACKAVKCIQCKYISFSASDLCKSERHTFKVFDAVKRFFKCGHCKNRTVCLEVVPMTACSNCGGSNWQKTGMMHEKIATAVHSLSIRGGEQKFTNSVATDANLDLLVPD